MVFIVEMVKLQTHSHLCHLWLSTQLITKQNTLIFTQPTNRELYTHTRLSMPFFVYLSTFSHYTLKHITYSPFLWSTGDKILNSKWLYMFSSCSCSIFSFLRPQPLGICFSFIQEEIEHKRKNRIAVAIPVQDFLMATY